MLKIAFIDFEASSLSSGSFPIEIGWVFSSGQGESYLIRPEPTWTMTAWSATSENIHGISPEQLDKEGVEATKVAKRMATALRDHTLYSDNPQYESYWLAMLYATANIPPPPVQNLAILIRDQMRRISSLNTAKPETPDWHRQHRILLDEAETLIYASQYRILLGHKTQHRALPDAQDMWRLFSAAKSVMDQRLQS